MAIRVAKIEDLPRILEIYKPYVENTAISFEYAVPTLEAFTQRFLGITKQFPWLVWEEEGTVLGYAYGSAPFERTAYQWSAEASIYLCPEAQGRGIGKKLYAALEEILQKQGYRKVYAIVTTANAASLAFHEAVGFRLVASMPECGYKFGQLHGITWLEKQLNSEEILSQFPKSVPEVVNLYRNFQ